MSTKEEFLTTWVKNLKESQPDVEEDEARRLGSEIWMGRDINYAIVDNDDFNLLAHRYFHGVASIRLQLLLMRMPARYMPAMPLIIADHMFALGFACGKADERGWDVDEVAGAKEAGDCLEKASEDPFMKSIQLSTREELDQADALPTILGADAEAEALPEGFKPSEDPGDQQEGGGGYYPN